MLLVVDAGNTNIVFAVHDGRKWAGTWRIATDPQRTSDEYAVWLLTLLTHAKLTPDLVSAAVIGTVVPAALYHLRRLCREWFQVEPLIARSTLDWGFDIRVDAPAEVGADRLLNALAAFHLFRQALIVIDFGTATTFDVVAQDGAYLGGAIAPGHQPVDRGAARRPRRRLPQNRHRSAAGGDRPRHRASDAIRHLLGLCGADRRSGDPNPAGAGRR